MWSPFPAQSAAADRFASEIQRRIWTLRIIFSSGFETLPRPESVAIALGADEIQGDPMVARRSRLWRRNGRSPIVVTKHVHSAVIIEICDRASARPHFGFEVSAAFVRSIRVGALAGVLQAANFPSPRGSAHPRLR